MHVGLSSNQLIEIARGPNNFFDKALIHGIATMFEECDADPAIRSWPSPQPCLMQLISAARCLSPVCHF